MRYNGMMYMYTYSSQYSYNQISGIKWMDSVIHQLDTTLFFPPAITCGGFVVRFLYSDRCMHVYNIGPMPSKTMCSTRDLKPPTSKHVQSRCHSIHSVFHMFLIFLYLSVSQQTGRTGYNGELHLQPERIPHGITSWARWKLCSAPGNCVARAQALMQAAKVTL